MADARTITQTLTVSFGADSGTDSLIAEIDSRSDGLNKGKTSFRPGDDVYILVYRSNNVTIQEVVSSKGGIALDLSAGVQIVELTDTVIFANERESSVSKPVSGAFDVSWWGNDLGAMTLDNDQRTLSLSQDPSTPSDPVYAGVASVDYTSEADVYKLTNTLIPNLSEYEIVIVIVGEAS